MAQWIVGSPLVTGVPRGGVALLVGGGLTPSPVSAGIEAEGWPTLAPYKGSETLELLSVAPNPARCGGFPNFEAQFAGQGIDTAGGIFDVEASGCQNIETGEVFDLVAVDTYADGSSVTIVTFSFTLGLDPDTCVSTNSLPVFYTVGEGTGEFAGTTGFGVFEFASNEPTCSGEVTPAYVWFTGLVG